MYEENIKRLSELEKFCGLSLLESRARRKYLNWFFQSARSTRKVKLPFWDGILNRVHKGYDKRRDFSARNA
jgi:hypothetical protein